MVKYGTSAYLLEEHKSPYYIKDWIQKDICWGYERALARCVELTLEGHEVHFPDDRSNPPRFRKTYE